MKTLFENPEFKAYSGRWIRRQQRLAYHRAYYDGTIYRNIRERFDALGQLRAVLGTRLYRGTKALFLMLARAVDVDAGIIPGGWALPADAPQDLSDAMQTVLAWSDWKTDGVLYVHYGALYGVSGLKVSDLREAGRVLVKPLDPCTFMLVRGGMYDATPRMAIIIEKQCGDDGETFEYAEVIEPGRVRTFKDGEPFGFDGRDAEYINEQGRVPVVEVHHLRTGEEHGEATYQKVIPILDELNELASYLADIVKKHAEAQWVVRGAEASDLEKSGDNIWFIPEQGDVKAMVAAIDIPGVLDFIKAIRDEVQAGLPELSFDELKSKTNIATATLELQLMELVLKVQRCRPNYDAGLVAALRLAGRAGASLGLGEIAVLDDEGWGLDDQRPVLPLDRKTQIEIEQAQLTLDQQRAMAQGGA